MDVTGGVYEVVTGFVNVTIFFYLSLKLSPLINHTLLLYFSSR